jgi:glycosyltransferase involved in cell wall biosynthesis
MRIGIEAQRLFRPHKHGMDRVALELIKSLQLIDNKNEYFIFVKPDTDNRVLKTTKNFKIVEVPGGFYPIWEQIKLPKIVKKYKCDVLHCTSNTAPLNPQIALITTLHDIIFKEKNILQQLSGSASWYQKLGNIYRSLIVEKVVKRSNRLITVSNYEKENIKKFFKLDDQRLKTVHNGVNENFKHKFNSHITTEIRKKYELPIRFMLHLGNTDPRKNTKRVLEAFYDYKVKFFGTCKLVIVGLNESNLKRLLEEVELADQMQESILLTGYVADQDLPVIFNMAELLLFPSLREGFGIPILEAMASGIPVITSSTSSMPEVAGESACLVNPYETEEVYKAIIKILSDHDYRNNLITKGLRQCKTFSWAHSAREVLELYEQLNTEQKFENYDKR